MLHCARATAPLAAPSSVRAAACLGALIALVSCAPVLVAPPTPVQRTPEVTVPAGWVVLGAYTTSFREDELDRSANIRVAAERLNGVTIEPGTTWSFNRTVGRRDVANGYRIAPTLTLQGKEPALGGGVCQVSTTLFNALLLADLGIVERHPHSRPVRYVALGRDAAVDWGSKDLKVQNRHPFPLMMTTLVDGGRLTTRLYGPSSLAHDVVVEVGDLEPAAPRKELQVLENPDDLAVGGVWVKLYRKRLKDGSVYEVERIGKPSFYPWKLKVPEKSP